MISLIFPTRNRAEMLELALESIVKQTLSNDLFEVLVVDNGSTDQTADIVDKFAKQLTNLRYIFDLEPGLHIGRHRGMLESRGDILVFADDDIEAFPSWLESIKESFSDNDVAMVGGNNLPIFLNTPPKWLKSLWINSEKHHKYKILAALSIIEFPYKDITEIDPSYIWGCNFSIRKSILFEAGGFHPDGMPEDLICYRGDGETHVSSFVKKSKFKAVFHPKASVYHKVTPERMTFDYFFKRGYNQGISNSYSNIREFGIRVSSIRNNFIVTNLHILAIKLLGYMFFYVKKIKVKLEQKRGVISGYMDHQRMYKESLKIQHWVHKEKYYD
jgi:glucosyl-dolichyl phosphate glucuronosyltransferase